ncbi:hypothetical protein RB597_001629 [Gaeumannomyces tritici]
MTFLFRYQKLLASTWGQNRWFLVTSAFIGVTSFAEFIVNLFACVPLEGFWDTAVDARCIPEQPYRYFFVGIDAIGALFILLLPALFLHTMSVGRPEAVVVAIVYALGLFVVILQFVRIRYVDLGVNFTWVNADRAALMMAELSVALLCSCALLLHPLAERLMPRWFCALEFDSSSGFSPFLADNSTVRSLDNGPKILMQKMLNHTPRSHDNLPLRRPPAEHTQAQQRQRQPRWVDDSGDASDDVMGLQSARRGLRHTSFGARRGTASEGNLRTFFAAAPADNGDEQQARASGSRQPQPQRFPAPPPRFAQPEPVRPSGVVVPPPPWMMAGRWGSQAPAGEPPGPPIRSSSLGRRVGNNAYRGTSMPGDWDGGSAHPQWQQGHKQQQGQVPSARAFQPPRPVSAEPFSELRRSATYHAFSFPGR